MSAPSHHIATRVWILFFVASFIWGFSFQMMKWGLVAFDSFQLASIRIISAGIFLLPFLPKHLNKISKQEFGWIVLSGMISSFIPAYCFCFAETKVDGTTAAILNSITPIWAFIIGLLIFSHRFTLLQFLGVIVGFCSVLMIILSENEIKHAGIFHSLLIVLATLGYALNVWIVSKKLTRVNAVTLSVVGLSVNVLPALVVFLTRDYTTVFSHPDFLTSLSAGVFLGVVGTMTVGYLFFLVIKGSSAVFASTVTYAIPVVGIVVGFFVGERITLWQVLGIAGILIGIYLSRTIPNKAPKNNT